MWNGSFKGSVKNVSWGGEDADYIKFKVPPGTWEFSASGTLELTSPKPVVKGSTKEIKLDKKNWTASASVKDSFFLFSGDKIPVDVSAANAIDGDHWAGWRDMTRKQYP